MNNQSFNNNLFISNKSLSYNLEPSFFNPKTGVDRYGFLFMLNKKLKLSYKPKTFCDWLHGWVFWEEQSMPIDILGPNVERYPLDLPVVTTNPYLQEMLASNGFKNVYAGGLPFAYTDEIKITREPGTLLSFLAHSAESKKFNITDNFYLDYLESIKNEWSKIYVSVYSLDWEDDLINDINKRGLIPLYGAHPSDKNSLNRTKINLLSAEAVSSNSMGSHIAYALSCGCKTSLFDELYELDPSVFVRSHNPFMPQDAERLCSFFKKDYVYNKFPKLFAKPSDGLVSPERGKNDIGARCKLSNNELLNILGWNFSGQIRGYSRILQNLGSKKQYKSSNGLNFFSLPIVEKTITNDLKKLIRSFKNKYIKVLFVKKFDQEIETILEKKRNSIFDFSLIIETNNINNNQCSEIDGENQHQSVLDIIGHLSLCDAREIAIHHDSENEFTSINRISGIKLIKLNNNEDHSKPDEGKKILAFVDTMPHLKKARQIEKNLSAESVIYATNDPEIFTNLNPNQDLYISTTSDIFFKIIFKLGINHFDSILVARVDSVRFQSIYALLKFKNLYTFDEGLFSIDTNSIYNSQLEVPITMGRHHFLFSKIFNFPKGAAFFYKNTDQHFTWFEPRLFKNTKINISKIFFLEEEKNTDIIKKIFIGQPWQFMNMDKKSLIAITDFINHQKFDLYLIHPREDVRIINSMLNEKISRVQVNTDGESFLVKMLNTSNPSVYTVASTIVTHLPASSIIKILTSDFYPQDVIHSQVNLIKALNGSKSEYTKVDISPNKDFQDKK